MQSYAVGILRGLNLFPYCHCFVMQLQLGSP